jgi:predicted transcriptional regulator
MAVEKIDKEKERQMIAIMRMKPTLRDTAELMGVSERTVERYIKKHFKQTFVEFRDQKMAVTRHMIIRGILDQCKKGNMTALIYASKNLCGWVDKVENTNINKDPIKIEIDVKDQEL